MFRYVLDKLLHRRTLFNCVTDSGIDCDYIIGWVGGGLGVRGG
jgi:hypothetical protein